MITLIRKLLSTFFLIIFLLLSAPTLLFLTKWYYSNLVMNKTYIGVVELPFIIEKSEETISAARTLFGSPDIKGIIINCDGQGGFPGSCQAIYCDLIKLKQLYKKPIIAFIEKESLAGSYLIATAADYIVSTEGAIIGNLGNFNNENSSDFVLKLKTEYYQQYYKNIFNSRKKMDEKNIILFDNELITGTKLLQLGLVDFLGSNLEIERLLRTKTIIEGSIEKVHGSFFEHFIFYIIDLINRIITNFKK
jgi:ClpP class serine protease